jgi:hypothetical protein
MVFSEFSLIQTFYWQQYTCLQRETCLKNKMSDKNEIYALCKINFFSVSLTVFDIISQKLRCLYIPRVAYLLNSFGLPNINIIAENFLSLIINTPNLFPTGRLTLHLHKYVFNILKPSAFFTYLQV